LAFVPIALETRIGQIVQRGPAAMLACDHVIRLVRQQRLRVRHPAVLTAPLGTGGYRTAKGRRDPFVHASADRGSGGGTRERMSITIRSRRTS